MSSEILIERLEAHVVSGERRWTGFVAMANGYRIDLLVLRVNGDLLAVRNRCPHRDVPLLRGRLDAAAGILECPSHGWELPLTGNELRGRPVIERDGRLFLVQPNP